jgi:hypothetical protein
MHNSVRIVPPNASAISPAGCRCRLVVRGRVQRRRRKRKPIGSYSTRWISLRALVSRTFSDMAHSGSPLWPPSDGYGGALDKRVPRSRLSKSRTFGRNETTRSRKHNRQSRGHARLLVRVFCAARIRLLLLGFDAGLPIQHDGGRR